MALIENRSRQLLLVKPEIPVLERRIFPCHALGVGLSKAVFTVGSDRGGLNITGVTNDTSWIALSHRHIDYAALATARPKIAAS